MTTDSKIIEKLNRIDPYQFSLLIDNLLCQGAFREIADANLLVESFGINIEKQRTIKSAPHSDTEIRSLDTIIEVSVEEDWKNKLKKDVKNNKGKKISAFVFCTNQDTANKTLVVDRKTIDAVDYCKSELNCENCIIIGQKDLLLRLQNPVYFYIRRRFLSLPEDFLLNPTDFIQQLQTKSLLSLNLDEEILKQCGKDIESELTFSPGGIIILHNDEYQNLLHALGLWAKEGSNLTKSKKLIDIDYCFIGWPDKNRNLGAIDQNEISGFANSFVVIWGADNIENISDYLKFNTPKTCLIFVTKTVFKDEVSSKLASFGGNINIKEISIPSVDQIIITPNDIQEHEEKIKALVNNTADLLLKLEALVYFYSPVYLIDEEKIKKINSFLKVDINKFNQLKDLMIENSIAAVTGNIFWLQRPGIGRGLLNDFINDGTFLLDKLI